MSTSAAAAVVVAPVTSDSAVAELGAALGDLAISPSIAPTPAPATALAPAPAPAPATATATATAAPAMDSKEEVKEKKHVYGPIVIAPEVTFVLGDVSRREQVSAERATALLADLNRAIDEKTVLPYQKIEIRNLSFGLPAAEVLGRTLERLEATVRVINFADIIAGQKTEEALAVLARVCAAIKKQPLLQLDLSDNALGPAGIDAVSVAIAGQRDLTRLFFNNNGLSAEASGALPALIASAHIDEPKLHTFECYNNMMSDKGAAAVASIITANNRSLRHIRCATTRLTEKGRGGVQLAEALRGCTDLQHLDLSDNYLGTAAAAPLAAVLEAAAPSLHYVALGDTALLGEDLTAICAPLAKTTNLQVLELNHLEMGHGGEAQLLPILRANPGLVRVNLEANDLGSSGVRAVMSALDGALGLTELNLVHNALTESEELIAFIVAWAVRHTKLAPKGLKLDENRFTEAGVAALQAAMEAAGRGAVLGSMDDQQEPADDDDSGGSDDDARDDD